MLSTLRYFPETGLREIPSGGKLVLHGNFWITMDQQVLCPVWLATGVHSGTEWARHPEKAKHVELVALASCETKATCLHLPCIYHLAASSSPPCMAGLRAVHTGLRAMHRPWCSCYPQGGWEGAAGEGRDEARTLPFIILFAESRSLHEL